MTTSHRLTRILILCLAFGATACDDERIGSVTAEIGFSADGNRAGGARPDSDGTNRSGACTELDDRVIDCSEALRCTRR